MSSRWRPYSTAGILPGVIYAEVLILLFRRYWREKGRCGLLLFLVSVHLGLAGFLLYAYYRQRYPAFFDLVHFTLALVIDCVYLHLIAGELFSLWHKRAFPGAFFFFLVQVSVIAPMIPLHEVGPRSYINSNLFYSLFLVMLLTQLWPSLKQPTQLTTLDLCALSSLVMCAYFGMVYVRICTA